MTQLLVGPLWAAVLLVSSALAAADQATGTTTAINRTTRRRLLRVRTEGMEEVMGGKEVWEGLNFETARSTWRSSRWMTTRMLS